MPVGARRRARFRPARDRAADGRRRRPAAGQRPPGRRHVPHRDRPVREAGHRPGDPDLGSRHLHRLRQVRHRLPARHHPHEGVHARGRSPARRRLSCQGRSRPRTCPATGSPSRWRPTTAPAAGSASTSARPRARPRSEHKSHQHGAGGRPRATSSGRTGTSSRRSRSSTATCSAHDSVKGVAGARAAVRVLRRLRRLRRDAVPQAGHASSSATG